MDDDVSNHAVPDIVPLILSPHEGAPTDLPAQGKRDECIAIHGPESSECAKLIEAHKACLREEGFRID